jgi:hypothetical protein
LVVLTIALTTFTALVVAGAAQQRTYRALAWLVAAGVVVVYAGPVAQRWSEALGDVRQTASSTLLRMSASGGIVALGVAIAVWQPGSRLAVTASNAVALLGLLWFHRHVLVVQRDYITSLPTDSEERLEASFEWATLGALFGVGVGSLGAAVGTGALGPFGTTVGIAESAVAVVGFAGSLLGLLIALGGMREQRRLGDHLQARREAPARKTADR